MDQDSISRASPTWDHFNQYKEAITAALQIDRSLAGIEVERDLERINQVNKAWEAKIDGYDFDKLRGSPEFKRVLELALKAVSMDIVAHAVKTQQSIVDCKLPNTSVPSIYQLFDLTRYLSSLQLSNPDSLLWLFIDVMEAIPVSQAGELFKYIENSVPHLREHFAFLLRGAPHKLRLLQMSNHLLSRLSRVQDVQLAGRIHLFLSQLLPSTDQSAINIKGLINDSHQINIEEVPEGTVDTMGEPVNAEFYQLFWSLQSKFQKPYEAIEPNVWAQVNSAIKEVLAEFQKLKCSVASGAINQGSEKNQENLTVRFIPSPKLLSLQLRDAGFRRHFLLQCLILIHAGSVKSQKNQETFRIKQQGDAADLEKAVYEELRKTPENGPQFAAAIQKVMGSENQWAEWKSTGATAFDKDPHRLSSHQSLAKRRKLAFRTQQKDDRKRKASEMNGHAEEASQNPMDELKEYLKPVIEDMDPEEGIEETYKRKNESTYKWEALRKISQLSYKDFKRVTQAGDLEEAVHIMFENDVPQGAKRKKKEDSAKESSVIPASLDLGAITAHPTPLRTEMEIEEPKSPREETAPDPNTSGPENGSEKNIPQQSETIEQAHSEEEGEFQDPKAGAKRRKVIKDVDGGANSEIKAGGKNLGSAAEGVKANGIGKLADGRQKQNSLKPTAGKDAPPGDVEMPDAN